MVQMNHLIRLKYLSFHMISSISGIERLEWHKYLNDFKIHSIQKNISIKKNCSKNLFSSALIMQTDCNQLLIQRATGDNIYNRYVTILVTVTPNISLYVTLKRVQITLF